MEKKQLPRCVAFMLFNLRCMVCIYELIFLWNILNIFIEILQHHLEFLHVSFLFAFLCFEFVLSDFALK